MKDIPPQINVRRVPVLTGPKAPVCACCGRFPAEVRVELENLPTMMLCVYCSMVLAGGLKHATRLGTPTEC